MSRTAWHWDRFTYLSDSGRVASAVRRHGEWLEIRKAFEKIASTSVAGEKTRLYAGSRRRRGGGKFVRLKGSEQKFHVLRQFPRHSDGNIHGTDVIHARDES